MAEKKEPRKRLAKPGTRRVMVTIADEDYTVLAALAESQLREPNNMLSYILKDRLQQLVTDYTE